MLLQAEPMGSCQDWGSPRLASEFNKLLNYDKTILTIRILSILQVILVLHGCFGLALAGMPLLLWLVYEMKTVPRGNLGVYDPTEIHNRDTLAKHLRDVLIYLGYYLLFFFVYLYCLIVALLKGDPIQRHHDDTIITEL